MKSKKKLKYNGTASGRNEDKDGIIFNKDDDKVQSLIDELELMRDEWLKQITEKKNKKKEYEILIKQLRVMKKQNKFN